MLKIQEVTKSFGPQEVLRGVNLDLSAGEIVALVGINGAGKSTLASIIAGLLKADGGLVTISGIDALNNPHAARRHLGLAAQDIGLYPTLTGRDNLNFFGRLAGVRSSVLRERTFKTWASAWNWWNSLTSALKHSPVGSEGDSTQRLRCCIGPPCFG